MAKVEVLYPFGGAKRGDVVEVPDDKAGALRRIRWAREIEEAPKAAAKVRRRVVQEKEPDIDAASSTETT
jgi:hypothetical protein